MVSMTIIALHMLGKVGSNMRKYPTAMDQSDCWILGKYYKKAHHFDDAVTLYLYRFGDYILSS
jgi:hypothetical protein